MALNTFVACATNQWKKIKAIAVQNVYMQTTL